MNIKLKDEWINKFIYVPFENRTILGKFIDKSLYPYMYEKYPDFFEIERIKKSKKEDDISINNAE